MDRPKLYAQFDGDEIDGVTYGLGDEIKDTVDAGTIAFLEGRGRIASAPPSVSSMIPIVDKPLDAMNRAELERTFVAEADLSTASDEDLKRAIQAGRDKAAAGSSDDDSDDDDEVYSDLKGKDLSKLKAGELAIVAEAEGVTFGDGVKTNADKVAAIQTARDAKAAALSEEALKTGSAQGDGTGTLTGDGTPPAPPAPTE
jgi:hypothetical protein